MNRFVLPHGPCRTELHCDDGSPAYSEYCGNYELWEVLSNHVYIINAYDTWKYIYAIGETYTTVCKVMFSENAAIWHMLILHDHFFDRYRNCVGYINIWLQWIFSRLEKKVSYTKSRYRCSVLGRLEAWKGIYPSSFAPFIRSCAIITICRDQRTPTYIEPVAEWFKESTMIVM